MRCELAPNSYRAGTKVAEADFDAINISRHELNGKWNYAIAPRTNP